MGACASRPSDDGASTSGSSKKSKAGKPGSDASTNPARVLNLGADAESYFARSGGRAFYASPPVSATDSVPRASLPRAAVEQAVTFESADGTHLVGVVHRPYDDDAGAMSHVFDVSHPPEDVTQRNAKRRAWETPTRSTTYEQFPRRPRVTPVHVFEKEPAFGPERD